MPTKTTLNLVLITALFGLTACNTHKAPTPVETKPAVAAPAPAPVVEAPAPSKPVAVAEPAPMTKKEIRAARIAAAKSAAAETKAAAKAKAEENKAANKSNTATKPAPAAEPATAPAATPAAPAAEVKPTTPKATAISQDQAMTLARKGNCLACHKIDSKLVGPAWKDVGAKYKGDATTIAANIKKGGSFGWKLGSMPPKGGSSLSDADIASLAGFIATLK